MASRARCYYEILGVERTATADELKKKYRKLALEYHPDKHPDDPDAAAKVFQELQHAYSVLSDPSEREWYDGHREQILTGDRDASCAPEELDLFDFFQPRAFSGFDDENSKSFFNVFRKMFDTLIQEDSQYAKVTAPSFGNSKTPYKEVATFYCFWLSYSTKKTFAWKEKFKINELPSRDQRRAAERMNQKERDAAKREYNKTLQEAVAFVKRRDPRVAAELERQEEDEEKREVARAKERSSALKEKREREKQWAAEAAAEEAAREAEEDVLEAMKRDGSMMDAIYETQAEARRKLAEQQALEEEEAAAAAAADQVWKCVPCKKQFKNEAQYKEHVQSGKHKAKIKQVGGCLSPKEEEKVEHHADPKASASSDDDEHHAPSSVQPKEKKTQRRAQPVEEDPSSQASQQPKGKKKKGATQASQKPSSEAALKADSDSDSEENALAAELKKLDTIKSKEKKGKNKEKKKDDKKKQQGQQDIPKEHGTLPALESDEEEEDHEPAVGGGRFSGFVTGGGKRRK